MKQEPTLGRFTRRLVSISAVTVALCLWVVTAPLAITVALVVDATARVRDARSALSLAWLTIGAILVAEVVGVVFLALAWLVSVGNPRRLFRLSFAVQCLWARFNFWALRTIYSIRFEMRGAEACARGPVVILARHSSIFDTLVPIVGIAAPLGVHLRYVMKRELLWDPCLDIAGQRLPNHFVARGSGDPAQQAAAVGALAVGLPADEGVLIYPEGTRFSPTKLAERKRQVSSTHPELAALTAGYTHVLPPRTAGALALIEAGHDVAILTHHGFDGIAGWADIWRGSLCNRTVVAEVRRIPADEIPPGREARTRWLFEQFAWVDAWVAERAAAAGPVGLPERH